MDMPRAVFLPPNRALNSTNLGDCMTIFDLVTGEQITIVSLQDSQHAENIFDYIQRARQSEQCKGMEWIEIMAKLQSLIPPHRKGA